MTFVSDFNVISMTGAEIALADVESVYEWAPSRANIERALTSRTKAVMLTHFAGILPAKQRKSRHYARIVECPDRRLCTCIGR